MGAFVEETGKARRHQVDRRCVRVVTSESDWPKVLPDERSVENKNRFAAQTQIFRPCI